MRSDRRILMSAAWLIIGAVLICLSFAGKVDSFWNGMGSGLAVIGVVQLLRQYRMHRNAEYREKMEVEMADERNRFLRGKAWAWAGYLYILIAAVSIIVFRVMGEEQLSAAAAFSVCLMLILLWCSYMILKKKY